MDEVSVIDRIGISAQKRGLLKELVYHFSVDCMGLYVLFDDSVHENCVNRRYRDRAFYMDIADGGIEEMSPDYVLNAMCSPTCQHFIWMSKAACLGSQPEFTWVLAHEMQHLVQRTSDKLTVQINGLLRCAYPEVGQPGSLQIDFPAEFDAELSAREAVRALLGDDALFEYLSVQCQTNVGLRYFDRFRCIEQEWSGNLRVETLRALCDHKADYARVRDSLGDPEFELDIDCLCRGYERLPY